MLKLDTLKLDTVEEALNDLKQGKMIVLVDDEDRENEGDLVLAAQFAKPEDINFMLTHGKGLICVTMSSQRLRKLDFPYQVQHNTSPFGTNFAVSFDLKTRANTGNSASARAQAIKHLTNENAEADDFILPGHVFPLGAVSGGVLKRRGQTEGSFDLCKLAKLEPVGVICEIMDNSGQMLRGHGLQDYCSKYELKLISIEQIVEYRVQNELSIRRIKELEVSSDTKLLVYVDDSNLTQHYALLVGGALNGQNLEHVKTYNQDIVEDIFYELSNGQPRIDNGIEELRQVGGGVLVYLRGDKPNLSEQILRDIKTP